MYWAFQTLTILGDIISNHCVQRDHRRGNVFPLVLVSFSAIVHILISEINCFMYQDYISRSFKPFPRYFLVSTPYGSNIYWLNLKKVSTFCDKTVIFKFNFVLFSESFYFHLCNKNTVAMGKISFYEFCAKWAVISLSKFNDIQSFLVQKQATYLN